MRIDLDKLCVYSLAGICGIAGFTCTYFLLGYLLIPIEDWITNKLKGVK